MFCSSCGKEVAGDNAKFCCFCGKEAAVSAASNSLSEGRSKPKSFEEFFQAKKRQRTSSYNTKKKTGDKRSTEEATVYASIMRNVDGELKQERGTRLPIIVKVSWDASNLKTAVYI